MSMTMEQYLSEITYALSTVLPTLWAENDEAERLHKDLHRHHAATQAGYQRAEALAIDAEDPDDVAMATGAHWETYWGPDRDRFYTAAELADVRQRMQVHAFSVSALAASVIQYAKQGIAIVHGVQKGDLSAVPAGRQVGSQALKDVVWQTRNQGLHWEDGTFRAKVDDCFAALARDLHTRFGDYRTRNMAFDVVEALGWRTFDDFAADMRTLA